MNQNIYFAQIPSIVNSIRREHNLQDALIKEDIFKILEKYCVVFYYPIEDEKKSRGFHIKRYLNGVLTDFVYINTAQPYAEQIFAAAHELGHVWNVAEKIRGSLFSKDKIEGQEEEAIVNRFAAELLMPSDMFKYSFFNHIDKLSYDTNKITLEELIRVMVMQMIDYMVPYEAVRRRMIETGIITESIGDVLNSDPTYIGKIVNTYLEDQNTTYNNKTLIKTIPGLRDVIAEAEKNGNVSGYLISKIKTDFSIEEVSATDNLIPLSLDKEN